MKAYWFDNVEGDQRLPHDSGRAVEAEYLCRLGILHYHFPTEERERVDALAAERGYRNRDEIRISPALLPRYEERVRGFFDEHLHEDEEIRYILDGGGYFDVRGAGDEWVRIRLDKGDLMIMPAGIYHRFTTDERNYTHAMRLFKEDPKWTPLARAHPDTDGNRFRKEYLQAREDAGGLR